jgi:hypothetical protein
MRWGGRKVEKGVSVRMSDKCKTTNFYTAPGFFVMIQRNSSASPSKVFQGWSSYSWLKLELKVEDAVQTLSIKFFGASHIRSR